jgi:hypothetical protein
MSYDKDICTIVNCHTTKINILQQEINSLKKGDNSF